MDKRKVNGGMAAGEDLDGRAAKRRKPVSFHIVCTKDMEKSAMRQKSLQFLLIGDGRMLLHQRFIGSGPRLNKCRVWQRIARLTSKKDHKISLSEETHETTTKIGLELVELVKRTADKRYVSTLRVLLQHFLNQLHQPRMRLGTYRCRKPSLL